MSYCTILRNCYSFDYLYPSPIYSLSLSPVIPRSHHPSPVWGQALITTPPIAPRFAELQGQSVALAAAAATSCVVFFATAVPFAGQLVYAALLRMAPQVLPPAAQTS